jgi:cystathionine beta-synthase
VLDLSNHAPGVSGKLLVKCEGFNPYGSFKDRLAKVILNDLQERGLLRSNTTLVLPTTGALALSLVPMVKKYQVRIILVVPEQVGEDKLQLLKSYGVEVLRTPWNAPVSSPESCFGVANRLCEEIKGAVLFDEENYDFSSAYDIFASELVKQGIHDLNYAFIPVESMKVAAGLSLALKKLEKDLRIIGVCAENSFRNNASKINSPHPSRIEGMFCHHRNPPEPIPSVIDDIVFVSDFDAFKLTRMLLDDAGLQCGSSTGAVIHAAIKYSNPKGDSFKALCISEDSSLLYPSTLLNYHWLIENEFINKKLDNVFPYMVADLDLPPVISVEKDTKIIEALNCMMERDFDQLPVVNEHKKLIGFVSLAQLQSLRSKAALDDPVYKWMYQWQSRNKNEKKRYVPVTLETKLDDLARFFEKNSVAFVTDDTCKWVIGVCTKFDLMKFAEKVNARFS